MKCPHCLVEIHSDERTTFLARDAEGDWGTKHTICPACRRAIVFLVCGDAVQGNRGGIVLSNIRKRTLVRPKGTSRPAPPSEVPTDYAEDYMEAASVLTDSPKASAALSRRLLQRLLREMAKVKPGDLADEIQQVLDSARLPSHLADAIDAIRTIGNFAAHPLKSNSTGEVVPVEPGEAEWDLDVLDGLFDFYFVQPDATRRKREALNAKLKDAGKPPMKSRN